jgi:hypothetical protein
LKWIANTDPLNQTFHLRCASPNSGELPLGTHAVGGSIG